MEVDREEDGVLQYLKVGKRKSYLSLDVTLCRKPSLTLQGKFCPWLVPEDPVDFTSISNPYDTMMQSLISHSLPDCELVEEKNLALYAFVFSASCVEFGFLNK